MRNTIYNFTWVLRMMQTMMTNQKIYSGKYLGMTHWLNTRNYRDTWDFVSFATFVKDYYLMQDRLSPDSSMYDQTFPWIKHFRDESKSTGLIIARPIDLNSLSHMDFVDQDDLNQLRCVVLSIWHNMWRCWPFRCFLEKYLPKGMRRIIWLISRLISPRHVRNETLKN